MKTISRITIILPAAAALTAIALLSSCSDGDGAPPRDIEARQSRLNVEVTSAGIIRPEVGAEVKIGPRISGVLNQLHVKVGDHVKRGALLAELDHRDLDAAVDSAMADVRRCAADREYQQALLSRRVSLRSQGLLAQEDLEVQRRDMMRTQAALDQANVALREARIKQGYASIEAPIDGTVSAIATQEGETVAASFAVPMFVTIVDLNRLHIEAYVNEFDIGKVHTGNTATITNETFRDKPLHGRVSAIIPGAVMRDKTPAYIVYVDLDADSRDARLKPDMTVDVRIATGVVREGIFIPLGLVRHDAGSGSYVLVVRKGAQPERRAVSLGVQDGGLIEVTRGLTAGERIREPKAQGENND